ncbi:low molecular weight phosphatase family protein [Pseudemcibacter sp.]|uniref:arsenate-mycothiol transferase ArsC n=1 Tax=Pseudemcibacter sp. TaxID=2943293 RepID=UPI003F6A14FD|nr:low molecular weight phosphatase family protein [Kordiimonadaceae bacterium]
MSKEKIESLLFVCNYNSVRSPIAECLAKDIFGDRVFIDSIGIQEELLEINPFAISVMEEAGLILLNHKPKHFEDLNDTSFDLIICLSAEAEEKMKSLTRGYDIKIELWETDDPSGVKGNRENIMSAFREMRDELKTRIEERL